MSRRIASRRRKPTSSHIEYLEPRTLLTASVSITAPNRDIVVTPPLGTAPLTAEFDLPSTGSSYPANVYYTETVTPSSVPPPP